ncbi:MAG: polyprenyl synthetase family protein [Candidatus Bathyarchaeota archaeon]|nr:polyprenyl synthetase family protein [Candidatus Bathyarchaeota archaeon]
MENATDLEKRFWTILNCKGSKIHEESKRILLEDIRSEDLRETMEYASKRYRDLLRPTLMVLSCEAVGGKAETVDPVAEAMSLLGMSLYIFDDVVDGTEYRCFVPTTMGKFGAGKTLIAGGLVTAKAFTLLNKVDLLPAQRRRLSKLFWRFLRGTAEAETANLTLRKKKRIHPEDKLAVMKMRTVQIEACTRAGAILGFGSNGEIDHLGKFGTHLGLILELADDLTESLNFTLELRGKIRMGSWPYSLACAENRSQRLRSLLSSIINEEIDSVFIGKIVEELFESQAVNHIRDLSAGLVARAVGELSSLKDTSARRALRFIAEVQSSLLPPSISYQGMGYFCGDDNPRTSDTIAPT